MMAMLPRREARKERGGGWRARFRLRELPLSLTPSATSKQQASSMLSPPSELSGVGQDSGLDSMVYASIA
ncbi:hypothetical protein BP00DRAFT_276257 [Aspergillus indologenus CBS 114.80]|uniref:Uncharacterized protein n=1 Tax=Aspergillus indologenus CBS 114.80 TaxID=1450541 RepID=A0A2V5HTZ5_9EURO|nr:hypothetical protein BP00DRAFT_276257 [Aspergillus indologenus CBS 114.80]